MSTKELLLQAEILIQELRDTGDDNYFVEAKAAHIGFPEIETTLSAFGNMPEGGVILFGLEQGEGSFDVVGVYDASDAVRVLASRARKAIEPPMQLGAITSLSIEGHSIVYCVVPPQPLDKKPFRVKKTKKAYIRSGDGDYELNDSEEQLLVNQRSEPIHEQEPVLDASVENDLADDLLEQYLQARISEAPRLQMLSRQEQLVRTSVIDLETGKPTLATIYAFGIHPQQFFPTLSVKARAIPAIPSQEGVRIIEPRDIGGPIPDLLESTMEWLSKVSLNAVSFDPSGHGKNVTELPGVAVREIVANALVHRDLSVAGRIEYVNVIKEGGKLTVSNPGGLWGLSVKQLGRTNPKPRNPILYGMCSKIATQNGNRVIEASATGIPEVRRAMSAAMLPDPRFSDSAVSFAAILSTTSLLSASQQNWLSQLAGYQQFTVAQKHALVAMKDGAEITNRGYREQFPMDSADARRELQELVTFGLVSTSGQNRGTTYRLVQQADIQAREDAQSPEGGFAPELYEDRRPRTKHISMPRRRELVLYALRDTPASIVEIASRTGLTKNQIAPALVELRENGEIEFTKPARSTAQKYRITSSST